MIENCGRCQRSGVKKIVKLIDDVSFIQQDSFKDPDYKYLVVSASKNDFSENDFCIISIIIYLHHPVVASSLSLVVKRENHQICKTSLQQCSKTNPRGKTYQLQAYLNIYQHRPSEIGFTIGCTAHDCRDQPHPRHRTVSGPCFNDP